MSDVSPESIPDPLQPEDFSSAGSASSQGAAPSPLEQALLQISELQQQLAAMKDQGLRALAEAENTRKRAIKDREDASKYAIANFARDILDYTDNFKRAIDSIPDELKASGDDRIKNMIAGLEAMQRQLLQTFEKNGVKKIEPRDEPFNPHFHEVMFEVPGTGKPAGTIIQLVDAGYILHDRLLRPARVGVAKDEGQGGSAHNVDTQA
ncbi:MAG: nucleotide exchange factor GrpE [Micavibrio aeruginosavorus]|uniref:Protein GrpE n=1 Tax=Micavibrio aeruginosavorus TaxID=349221 RepID=A0A7T5R438_9BACT|nr:MAG: nucleotide exchange factor GrpE [Micavibrio aeruginosavorus]